MRAVILIVVLVACLYAMYAFAYTPYSCDRSLSELMARTRLASTTGRSFEAVLTARRNLADLKRIERPCRTRVLLYTLEAENEYVLGRKEASIEALRRGLRVEPRPEIHMAIGSMLVELGRMDEAVEHFVRATQFSVERVNYIASPEARRRVEERLQQIAAQQPQ